MNENKLKLEDMLMNIGGLNSVLTRLNNAEKQGDRVKLYQSAYQLIDPSNPDVLTELTRNPESAIIQVEMVIGKRAGDINNSYQENKENIIDDVEKRINESLKETKGDGAKASQLMLQYLNDVFEDINISQDEANMIARKNLMELGMHPFETMGSPAKYKDLRLRNAVAGYLKPIKEGEQITGYTVNKYELAKTMEDVIHGATIYKNSRVIEKNMEKAKEAAKSNERK
ncbi:hypothetical protein J4425_01420 [Candidatus Woesearchaeota archaeon]|nr:hypothetical protein [Candidatus Woesearchaeota archaeon]